jgi:rhodanese-related sulfurtransferase
MDFAFIQSNVYLIVIAVASGAMLLWTFVGGGGGMSVGVTQATLLINRQDAQVLDVREASEFSNGHIAASVNIPVGKVTERIAELEKWKSKPLIICCASGQRSLRAVGALKKNGFTDLHVLEDGLAAWEKAGLPLAKGRK